MAREEEDLITIQNDQIKKLKAQNASLAAKSTQLVEQLEKKKREAALMKRTASLNKKAPTKEKPVAVDIDIVPAPSKRPNSAPTVPAHDPLTDSNLLEVARKYKQRYIFELMTSLLC